MGQLRRLIISLRSPQYSEVVCCTASLGAPRNVQMTLPSRRAALAFFAFVAIAGIVAIIGARVTVTQDSPGPINGAALVPRRTNADATPPRVPFDSATPRLVVRAKKSYPHDTSAFTEGLLLYNGRLLESTGLEGHSEVREVDATTGLPRRRVTLSGTLFGEGIAVVESRLYQLTWQTGRGFVYDATSFAPVDSFSFSGEGWGLTADGVQLYMSDGSDHIRVITPAGFKSVRTIAVTESGRPVWMLNELEWVRGELWANVYQTDLIARIDPSTGIIRGWLDLSQLQTPLERETLRGRGAVANGIAVDSIRHRALVTGKLWPKLYEFDIPSRPQR